MREPFIHPNFLLQSERAEELFHRFAAPQPILDYHSHLVPADLAGNRVFKDLGEIWLEGDHYKWRAMRANGIEEKYCTGDAEPYEKFLAWARTVPKTLRNPLFHWTHLELKRYFEIDALLDESTAPEIWEQANRRLAQPDRSVHGILDHFDVQLVCTTDDPTHDLRHHKALAASGLKTSVRPTFRPDALLRVEDPEAFRAYVDDLGEAADKDVGTFQGLLEAFEARHDYFHEAGCRLSDHGLVQCHAAFKGRKKVARIYDRLRSGQAVPEDDAEAFRTFIMVFSGQLDAQRGWVKQLHLGALRNTNTRGFRALGRDAGFDSIGDFPQAERLAAYLDRLDQENHLPKTIIYNLNPADNYVLATMIGNFQDGTTAGKVQMGSGWWFLDQLEGMTWQLNALSSQGLLSRFVGMLTDSRSFMSFPRHEYFRRLLCNLLGDEMEKGLLPDNMELVGTMVSDLCCENARTYLGLLET